MEIFLSTTLDFFPGEVTTWGKNISSFYLQLCLQMPFSLSSSQTHCNSLCLCQLKVHQKKLTESVICTSWSLTQTFIPHAGTKSLKERGKHVHSLTVSLEEKDKHGFLGLVKDFWVMRKSFLFSSMVLYNALFFALQILNLNLCFTSVKCQTFLTFTFDQLKKSEKSAALVLIQKVMMHLFELTHIIGDFMTHSVRRCFRCQCFVTISTFSDRKIIRTEDFLFSAFSVTCHVVFCCLIKFKEEREKRGWTGIECLYLL